MWKNFSNPKLEFDLKGVERRVNLQTTVNRKEFIHRPFSEYKQLCVGPLWMLYVLWDNRRNPYFLSLFATKTGCHSNIWWRHLYFCTGIYIMFYDKILLLLTVHISSRKHLLHLKSTRRSLYFITPLLFQP